MVIFRILLLISVLGGGFIDPLGGNAADGGPGMDPNGGLRTDDGVAIDPHGGRAAATAGCRGDYTACVDPNG